MSLSYPLAHDYVSTPHPRSPHSPPATNKVTQEVLEQYERDGVVVLKNFLPQEIVDLLKSAVNDVVANNTVNCKMAYFTNAPIFHR